MLTGTPLDLTPFGAVLQGIGVLYWVLALVALVTALMAPKTALRKAGWTALVLLVFGYMPAAQGWQAFLGKQRLNESVALFKQRCQTAGERITRTVDNVEGVVWMKWRPREMNQQDQYRLDDPYGHDCGGDSCILNLLRVTRDAERNPEGASQHKGAYTYVESIDPSDGQRYRYVAVLKTTWSAKGIAEEKARTGEGPSEGSYRPTLERQPIDAYSARYGITWDDISSRKDRDHWIAGSSLKVIDLQTREVIAERIGYMMDRGQGSTAGFRSPWSFAHDVACPEPRRAADGRAYRDNNTIAFANKVLRPIQGGTSK